MWVSASVQCPLIVPGRCDGGDYALPPHP